MALFWEPDSCWYRLGWKVELLSELNNREDPIELLLIVGFWIGIGSCPMENEDAPPGGAIRRVVLLPLLFWSAPDAYALLDRMFICWEPLPLFLVADVRRLRSVADEKNQRDPKNKCPRKK